MFISAFFHSASMSKKIKVKLDTVNLQEEGYHLFIKGEIGNHPVRLLIDTGASTTVIDKNFLSEKFPDLSLSANEQLTTELEQIPFRVNSLSWPT
jgi:hypothetical protein